MDALNLDCMPDDEADDLRRDIVLEKLKTARRLFPGRPRGYVTATAALHHYLVNMLMSRKFRLQGKIDVAMRYEGTCDQIYRNLPEFARW